MIEERRLLYLKKFYQNHKGELQDKYCLIVKDLNGGTLLVNIPSSQPHMPWPETNVKSGCINLEEHKVRCFCFLKDTVCTDKKHKFRFNTFLHARWVQEFNLNNWLNEKSESDINDCGKIDQEFYIQILECLADSRQISQKFRREINEILSM